MHTSQGNEQLPNTYLRQFFRFLGSRKSLLEGTSETPESLAQLDGSNSFRDYCQFFYNAREQLNDPAIGLRLGRVNQLNSMHGPLSTVIYNSLDLRDCLTLLQRFAPLRLPVSRFQWIQEEKHIGLEISFSADRGKSHRSVTEALLLSIINIILVVSEERVRPSRVELDYPQPSYALDYPSTLKSREIRFSQPAIRILIDRVDANLKTNIDVDLQLRTSAIDRLEELLHGSMSTISTSDKIKQIFANNPGRLWGLKEIAQHMNMSDRTLQRRLGEEETRYQTLQNQWLMKEACQLLREKNLSIESISLLLGYSDVSNFRHACRRWYGVAPNLLRLELQSSQRKELNSNFNFSGRVP